MFSELIKKLGSAGPKSNIENLVEACEGFELLAVLVL